MLSPLLFLLLKRCARRKNQFRSRLTRRQRRHRDRRISRAALQAPAMSAFATLFGSGSDQALITLTGFDHRAFRYVLGRYEEVYNAFSPYSHNGYAIKLRGQDRRGRPRSLDATQSLALTLAWTRTRGAEFALFMLFGVTASVGTLFLRFGRRILLRILSRDDNAAVKLPTPEKIQQYQAAFLRKHSLLTDIYAVMDGLKLYLQQSGDCTIQNMFFNGWKHDHFVGNIFVFVPDGTIIACGLNAPGSLHDSQIAETTKIYSNLQRVYEDCGARCVVASAFAAGDYPFLVKSSQYYLGASATSRDIVYLKQATSARQTAEWGMRAFQSSFPQLKDRFVYEEKGERRLILEACVLIFNLRARLIGINQILSVYMPELAQDVHDLLP